jgi:hypothetical protein
MPLCYIHSVVDIPPYLEQQISSGKAVLVLGAGASLGSTDSSGKRAPKTDELRDLLADKFLGGRLKNRSLSQVAEYAMSESSLVAVQEFIRQQLWWGLATTNYDRLIEKAYENSSKSAQHLVPFVENGESIDEYTRDPENLLLLKLHGCITKTANADCPLILTIDQYIDHKSGRSRVFDQLTDWGFEHVFVFIGHSLQDSDIRQILKDLDHNASTRSRFFCVVPDADPIEQRALEQRRITVVTATFDDFMKTLDSKISAPFRQFRLSSPASTLPIAEQFKDRTSIPSKALSQFLTVDADYVNAIAGVSTVAPGDFYKGFNPGFSAIEQTLDVRRGLADEIMTDVFLADESEHADETELVLLTQKSEWGTQIHPEELLRATRPRS